MSCNERDYSEIDEQIPFDTIRLTDLIEVETLQKIQDSFSRMLRMAALTTDANGKPLTKGSNFSRFCNDFCRKSKIGRARCEKCDIDGALMAHSHGGPVSYYCHAGLVDFAAPIMVRGRLVGSFIGGQVLASQPNLEKMARIAHEIQVDEKEFLEAAKETTIVPQAAIDRGTNFIYSFTEVISDIAYQSYVAKKLYEKAKSASKAKSDFLANMSHEIRTPMNAVLGMADIALRENLPRTARESINQIVTSGKLLITIINDILDYSKIEAGKMEIVEEPYEPLSILNDLSNIILTKIGDKNVELLIDANPSFPRKISGDCMRIKQVITNLANNAAKFTNEGKVHLHFDYEKIGLSDDDGSEIINLKCSIEDTGVGIKSEDKEKLFTSFQQLDTKRNRNVEGTGLGLAISKNFLELMGGEIFVESEYGKGSVFSFTLPQTVKDPEPCFKMEGENFFCAMVIGNKYVQEQLEKDFSRLGIDYVVLDILECLCEIQKKGIKYLFIEKPFFSEEIQNYTKTHHAFTAVVISSINTDTSYPMRNVRVLYKPVYVLNIISVLKNISMDLLLGITRKEDFAFTAPDACALIVDDNEVNLTVAKGLLEPIKMHLDTATSGKGCLEKIAQKKYDIIFMDHMMPVLDGVETAILIRRDYPEYKDTPIIALTANVLAETKSVFFQSGMNDFVGKPIELKVILPKIKKWLPQEKIVQATQEELDAAEQKINQMAGFAKIDIAGLDTEYALGLVGSEALFWDVLKGWYKQLEKKTALIQSYKESKNWKLYTIEVHALKSSSRQIGALEVSNLAAELEKAGGNLDIDLINEKTDLLLSEARDYIPILEAYFKEKKESSEEKEVAQTKITLQKIEELLCATCDLDIDKTEKITKDLDAYKYSTQQNLFLQQLKDAVESMDMEVAEKVAFEWKKNLQENKKNEKPHGLLTRCLEIIN